MFSSKFFDRKISEDSNETISATSLPEHGNTTAATRSQGDETFHLSGGENSRPIHPDSVLPILEGSQPRS